MPTEACEKIASMLSDAGKYNDDALNLAHTRGVRRRAVLASLSISAKFDPRSQSLNNAWADFWWTTCGLSLFGSSCTRPEYDLNA